MNAKEINTLFRDKGRTLGSVESFTGGMFASDVISVEGASHFFKGALVTYMTEEKVRLLGIPYDLIDKFGVVSKEVAEMMATLGSQRLAVDYCIAFTGNAGPKAMEGKPVGEVYIAVCAYQNVEVIKFNLKGDRDTIRKNALEAGYIFLEEMLKKYN